MATAQQLIARAPSPAALHSRRRSRRAIASAGQRLRVRVSNARGERSHRRRILHLPGAELQPRARGMPLMTDRIKEFLARNREDGPRLVVDLDVVRENYLGFAKRAARHPRLLRGQGQSGAGDPDAARRARLVLRHGLARRDRAGARRRRDARPHQLRQHDQEGKGHRARLCARRPPLRGRLRGGGREDRARRARARKCSAASCATARAPNGRCRASSAARRRWRRGCSSAPMRSASSPMACRSTSARSSATRACGTGR